MLFALLTYNTSSEVLNYIMRENGLPNHMTYLSQILGGLLTSKTVTFFKSFVPFLNAFTVKYRAGIYIFRIKI